MTLIQMQNELDLISFERAVGFGFFFDPLVELDKLCIMSWIMV